MKLDVRKILLFLCLFLMIGCSIAIGYSLKKCDCKIDSSDDKTIEDDILNNGYTDLNDLLYSYLNDIYNNDKWMNGNVELGVYVVTLNELKDKGYDISMFVNPITKRQCNLDDTYGKFTVIGTTDDGKTDYTFTTNVSCPVD